MKLDRYTTEGKKFIGEEKRTGRFIEVKYGVSVVHTTFDAEKFDIFINKGDELTGIAEIKTRPYFNRKLKKPRGFSKEIKEIQRILQSVSIPFFSNNSGAREFG